MAKATVDLSGLKSKSKKFIKYISTNTAEKLCLYAERLLEKAYNEKKFENDTYNLADSYFWVVFVDGVKYRHGFLGDKKADQPSKWHKQDIHGRERAGSAISGYKPTIKNGVEVVIGAAAPYGGALEYRNITVISSIFDEMTDDFGSEHIKKIGFNEFESWLT